MSNISKQQMLNKVKGALSVATNGRVVHCVILLDDIPLDIPNHMDDDVEAVATKISKNVSEVYSSTDGTTLVITNTTTTSERVSVIYEKYVKEGGTWCVYEAHTLNNN